MPTEISNNEHEQGIEPVRQPSGTFFASPERLGPAELHSEVAIVSTHPLMTTLLGTVGGLLAVLNQHRQILAVNEALLTHLGVGSAESFLGLRLGEALHCPFSQEMEGGCGTSRYCSTCGAAIAQAVALRHNRSTERFCAIETQNDGTRGSLYLKVRASPLSLDGQNLILVFIEDYTRQQQNALAARSFHHDINNTLTCLLHASETVVEETGSGRTGAANDVHRLTERIVRELELQRQLTTSSIDAITPCTTSVTLGSILGDLRAVAENHPAAGGKGIEMSQPKDDLVFLTDPALLLRVLGNMAINALEATRPAGQIRIKAEETPEGVRFETWNETPIPPEIARRIFQRNFSTKGSLGRGLGTYSMKLVGEQILRGKVSFESSAMEGTHFRFLLPM